MGPWQPHGKKMDPYSERLPWKLDGHKAGRTAKATKGQAARVMQPLQPFDRGAAIPSFSQFPATPFQHLQFVPGISWDPKVFKASSTIARMPGRRGGRAQREEGKSPFTSKYQTQSQLTTTIGLERTDNNMDLTTWPVVNMINQKNYYTEYLKRDDQYLAYRVQNEEARNRMVREAQDRDRALAQGIDVPMTDSMGMPGDEDMVAPPPTAYGSKTIVVHLGSQNLRLGLASDALPKTVPMVIARKSRQNESEEADEPRPKRIKIDGHVPEQSERWFGEDFARQYTDSSTDLKQRMRNNKRRVLPNAKELVLNHNRRTAPETITEHNDPYRIEWTEIPSHKFKKDFITGHDALRIPENSSPRYKLSWPIRHGWFNEKDYVGKNLLYQDIATIIEQAVFNELGLQSKKEWSQYGVVLVIPDTYERRYVVSIMDIMLRDLGFGKICLQQESLAATFGAGYSISCIVDIGAQKTSICCVDEGLCLEDSRMNLKFGGYDVTETFIRMMLYDRFPYADINLLRRYDFLLAEELKQKFCSMDENEYSVTMREFHLRAAGQDTRKYSFRTFDETWLAIMGYFRPSLFDHDDKLRWRRRLIPRSVDIYDGSPNDPFPAAQGNALQWASDNLSDQPGVISDAPITNAVPTIAATTSTPAANGTPMRQPPLSNLLGSHLKEEHTPRSSVAGSPVPEEHQTPQAARDTPANGVAGDDDAPATSLIFQDPVIEKTRAADQRDRILPLMPLDLAIMSSITLAARGDPKKTRDFFGGIMLVGGGSKFIGLGQFLEERLKELNPGMRNEILIGPPPRELDPQAVVWKGASVFGKLSSSGNDAWVTQEEYGLLGDRLLIHKCMFPW